MASIMYLEVMPEEDLGGPLTQSGHMVVSKVVNRVAHIVADMDFSIIFWAFLGEFFCNSQC